MKFLILLLSLALVCAADHHEHHHHHADGASAYVVKSHDDLVSYRNACVEKVNAPAELVAKYKKWQFPDDAVTHCYMACIFEKFGFYDAEHGFDVHKVHVQLSGPNAQVDHSDETHQKIEQCAETNAKEHDSCAKAYHSGMCFMNANLHLVQHSVQV